MGDYIKKDEIGGAEKHACSVNVGKPGQRCLLGIFGVVARIILEWIVKRMSGRGLDSSGSRQGQMAGC